MDDRLNEQFLGEEKYKVGFDKICADYNRETQARNFLAVMQKL